MQKETPVSIHSSIQATMIPTLVQGLTPHVSTFEHDHFSIHLNVHGH